MYILQNPFKLIIKLSELYNIKDRVSVVYSTYWKWELHQWWREEERKPGIAGTDATKMTCSSYSYRPTRMDGEINL